MWLGNVAKASKFNEDLIKNHNEESNERYRISL